MVWLYNTEGLLSGITQKCSSCRWEIVNLNPSNATGRITKQDKGRMEQLV